jgi:hypothetical protein
MLSEARGKNLMSFDKKEATSLRNSGFIEVNRRPGPELEELIPF